jgi:hypothetical protein
MEGKSQDVFINLSAQEIQSILEWHPWEMRDYTKAVYDVHWADAEIVKSVDLSPLSSSHDEGSDPVLKQVILPDILPGCRWKHLLCWHWF